MKRSDVKTVQFRKRGAGATEVIDVWYFDGTAESVTGLLQLRPDIQLEARSDGLMVLRVPDQPKQVFGCRGYICLHPSGRVRRRQMDQLLRHYEQIQSDMQLPSPAAGLTPREPDPRGGIVDAWRYRGSVDDLRLFFNKFPDWEFYQEDGRDWLVYFADDQSFEKRILLHPNRYVVQYQNGELGCRRQMSVRRAGFNWD